MTTYAVTGATGHLGRLAIEDLLARGVHAADVIAVVRTPSKASDLAERGVQVRVGDYDQPETLNTAFAGVQRLLFVSGSEVGKRQPQHQAVIDAAAAAGVARVVYTSLLNAGFSSLPIAGEHLTTEAALKASGVPFTVLRNGWYTENYTAQLQQYLTTRTIIGATNGGRISAATRADYAAAAATALTADEFTNGAVHELGGPSFTLDDLAAAVSAVTGTEVSHRNLPSEEYAAALQSAGLDAATAGFFAVVDTSIAHGDLHTDSEDLARLLSRPVTPLTDALRTSLNA